MRPGQLGPMQPRPAAVRCASIGDDDDHTAIMSRTGMPSVMQTMSATPASAAS